MQKRKFDELISYFNRKVSEMNIGTSYKMELLGMVTALGYAHEKETEERKTGRWIAGRDERFVKCSECGMESTKNALMGIALFGEKEPHFCPNCGADMRGEQDGKNT